MSRTATFYSQEELDAFAQKIHENEYGKEHLDEIVRLGFADGPFEAFPQELYSLKNIEGLFIRLRKRPGEITRTAFVEGALAFAKQCQNLTTLTLNNCALGALNENALSDTFGKLSGRLRSLDLGDNKPDSGGSDFDAMCENIPELPQLERLRLSDCNLHAIPGWIRKSDDLRVLDLSGNDLNGIALDATGNTDTPSAPQSAGTDMPQTPIPQSIEILLMQDCGLRSIPEWVFGLESLRDLDLSDNAFAESSVADGSGTDAARTNALPALTDLSLARCGLERVPGWVCKAEKLQSLNLADNELHDLPEELANLTHLVRLNLSANQISGIPRELALGLVERKAKFCEHIPRFYTERPSSLNALGRRVCVTAPGHSDRSDSPVAASAPDPNLPRFVGIAGLKLTWPTDNIRGTLCENDEKQILAVYEAFKQETVTLNEAKVIFLGNGNAGKTHTVLRLEQGGKDEDDIHPDQTDGIFIKELYLQPEAGTFSPDPSLGDSAEIKTRMWDFGGQHIMHSMHRCFLTRRCLYVVVLRNRANMGANDLTNQAIRWLNNIYSFAEDADVVIAVNCEEGTCGNAEASFSTDAIRQAFPQSKEQWSKDNCNLVFYCAKGSSNDRFRDFQKTLATRIAGLESTQLILPSTWREVKEYIENLGSAENDKPYITADRFVSLCEQAEEREERKRRERGEEREPIEPAEMEERREAGRIALLKWLNDLGICFSYENQVPGRDYMVLKPEWITAAVYAIITNAGKENSLSIAPDHGCLKKAEIEKILKSEAVTRGFHGDDPSWKPYENNEIDYILQVMRKFDLSYEISDSTGRYKEEFIPAICPELQTTDDFYPDETLYPYSFRFKITYPFLPDGVIHKTMVLCLKDGKFRSEDCYRRAFRWIHDDGNNYATVKAGNDEKTIYITVYCKESERLSASMFRDLRDKIYTASMFLDSDNSTTERREFMKANLPPSSKNDDGNLWVDIAELRIHEDPTFPIVARGKTYYIPVPNTLNLIDGRAMPNRSRGSDNTYSSYRSDSPSNAETAHAAGAVAANHRASGSNVFNVFIFNNIYNDEHVEQGDYSAYLKDGGPGATAVVSSRQVSQNSVQINFHVHIGEVQNLISEMAANGGAYPQEREAIIEALETLKDELEMHAEESGWIKGRKIRKAVETLHRMIRALKGKLGTVWKWTKECNEAFDVAERVKVIADAHGPAIAAALTQIAQIAMQALG